MKSKYVLQMSTNTRCTGCNAYVWMLADAKSSSKKPWFYVCFKCEQIAEIGKGPVPKA